MLARRCASRLRPAPVRGARLASGTTGVVERYEGIVAADSAMVRNEAQAAVAARLDRLFRRVPAHIETTAAFRAQLLDHASASEKWAVDAMRADSLARAGKGPSEREPRPPPPGCPSPPPAARGLYLWGPVGTGKSLLMDTFYDALVEGEAGEAALRGKLATSNDAWERLVWQGPQPDGSPVAETGVPRDPQTGRPTACLGGAPLPAAPSTAGVARGAVRRVHFHDWMSEVHAQMHCAREALLAALGRRGVSTSGTGAVGKAGPPANAAAAAADVDVFASHRDAARMAGRRMADGTAVLCLDEMQVNDVVDALVVSRVFTELFRLGVVVVTTSNRPLGDLYRDGLNRELFLPFLDLLAAHCRQEQLDAGTDFRTAAAAAGGAPDRVLVTDSTAVSTDNEAWLLAAVARAAGVAGTSSAEAGSCEVALPHGRSVQLQCVGESAAVLDFATVCEQEFGAGDYRAVANRFPVVGLQGVRRLGENEFDTARRLVTLIDELYEARALLVLSADAQPAELLGAVAGGSDDGIDVNSNPVPDERLPKSDPAAPTSASRHAQSAAIGELRFACGRAASRLAEMLSPRFEGGSSRARTLQRRA